MKQVDFEKAIERAGVRLTPAQQKAVHMVEGSVLLLAVPGSGKTTVLVSRLGYMINECGIDPSSILAMTYTNAAANDMVRRYACIFGEEQAEKLCCRTINAVAYRVMNHFAWMYGGRTFPLLKGEHERNAFIREAYKRIYRRFPDELTIKNAASRISYIKNMLLGDEMLRDPVNGVSDIADLYRCYCNLLVENKKIDFDDQLVNALRLLKTDERLLGYYRSRFQYLLVDEAQDTSKVQHEIIKLIAAPRDNLFMVGDEDQSIYGFRAAYPEALLRFGEEHSNAVEIKMEHNFRSADRIIKAANGLIRNNAERIKKSMVGTRCEGGTVKLVRVGTRSEQYNMTASAVRLQGKRAAVLYRDNLSAVPLIDIMLRKGIPFVCRGTDAMPLENTIAVGLFGLLRLAVDPMCIKAFADCYSKLNLFLRREEAESAVEYSKRFQIGLLDAVLLVRNFDSTRKEKINRLISLLAFVRGQSAEKAVKKLLTEGCFADYIEINYPHSAYPEIFCTIAKNCGDIDDFLHRIEELKRVLSEGSSFKDGVKLSTIHSAKGLEYDIVHIIDATNGILPKEVGGSKEQFSVSSGNDVGDPFEEERRLFYVAMTRARDELYLYDLRPGGHSSAFLTEVEAVLNPRMLTNSWQTVGKKKAQAGGKGVELSMYSPGTMIEHKRFGIGMITSVLGDTATVRFKDGEKKQLSLEVSVSNGIISIPGNSGAVL